jgi:hypothetical protein
MKFNNIPVLSWELIDPDNPEKNIGHSIRMPNRCMDEILYHFNSEHPMCIEVKKMDAATNEEGCVIFGNIEIGNDEIIVAPFWALAKLGVEPFSLVSIENVESVRKAGFIKVRPNHSSYVYWDGLKETLETEFSKLNYISVGDPINIFGVEFYVMELHDTEGIGMLDGCLFNTDIEIDFETPMDIIEEERLETIRIEEEKRLQLEAEAAIRKKAEEDEQKRALQKKNHFVGKGYRINGDDANATSQQPRTISREERALMFQKLFEKQHLEKLEQEKNKKP